MVDIAIGQSMLLNTYHLCLKANPGKLKSQYIGPFPVTEAVSTNAFHLALPASMKIHPVFSEALLYQYNSPITTPAPVEADSKAEHEVHRMLHHRSYTQR